MKTNLLLLMTLLGLFISQAGAQSMRPSREKALDSLSKLKKMFKESTNDTAFVSKYSERPYQVYYFSRGDQAADIEEQIYSSSPGDVVGPFRGYDSSNFLFKVVSIEEYRTRSKASLVIIKPNAPSKQDTASIRKYAEKYSEAFKKGKNIREMAEKDNVRLIIRDLDWYYEGLTQRDHYELVMNSNKGDSHILNSVNGASLLNITNAKEKVPFAVRLIAVIRKG